MKNPLKNFAWPRLFRNFFRAPGSLANARSLKTPASEKTDRLATQAGRVDLIFKRRSSRKSFHLSRKRLHGLSLHR
jgi:hypothetical protein